jgi:hypothetical protein
MYDGLAIFHLKHFPIWTADEYRPFLCLPIENSSLNVFAGDCTWINGGLIWLLACIEPPGPAVLLREPHQNVGIQPTRSFGTHFDSLPSANPLFSGFADLSIYLLRNTINLES